MRLLSLSILLLSLLSLLSLSLWLVDAHPITIELRRHTSPHRAEALRALQQRHGQLRQQSIFMRGHHHLDVEVESNDNTQNEEENALPAHEKEASEKNSLLEQKEVPLEEEILSEKHLATYYGTIQIDHSPFRVLFDTGSCEFWVPSSDCRTERCAKHNRYPADTPRFRQLLHSRAWPELNIQYLSGRVQGKMISQTVRLGDVVVENQPVGLANVVDIDLLDDVEWDGIMGLAYPNPSLSNKGVAPIFDTILKDHVLSNRHLSNQFAYYIDDTRGSVTFGGANCDLISHKGGRQGCIDKFKFIPVTEKTYWTVTIKDIHVQYPGRAVQSGFCAPNGCKAIVDTGTYLIYGPEEQVTGMVASEIKSCNDYQQMPTLTFFFYVDGKSEPVSLTLKPIDYILKFAIDSREECVVGVSPDKDTIWTLGQVFLRSFYTVFDRDADRIGFARIPRKSFQALNAHAVNSDNRKGRSHSMLEVNEEMEYFDNF